MIQRSILRRRPFARGLAGAALALGAVPGLTAGAVPARAQTAVPDSTFDRVRSTRKLRVGVVAGQAPYCTKDLATGKWTGFIPTLGAQLAAELDAEMEPVESGWGNAVLDLQSGKVDIFFGQNPTPRRALAVDFTAPLFTNAFSLIARRDFQATSWAALNDPSIKLAVEIGTSYDQISAELCAKAAITRTKTAREATLEVQSGRADAQMIVALLSLAIVKANPGIGKVVVPTPVLGTTTAAAVRRERDKTFRDFVNVWIDYSRGLLRVRGAVLGALAGMGISDADIPAQISF